jgi:hypothetical protein
MLHAVLDTSIYSGNPLRNNLAFRALIRLAKAGRVQLHISEITKREFTGQQSDRIESPLKEALASLKKLRKSNKGDEFGAFATETMDAIAALAAKAKSGSKDEFEAWLKDLNATESTMTVEDTQVAFDAYFEGTPPFKKVKSREDIPDAFIWQAVKRLLKTHKELHFVVADKTLRASAEDCDGITAYASLDDFIQTEECQAALEEISTAENRARIEGRLQQVAEGLTKIVQTDLVNALDGKTVEDSSIPDDNNEGMVTGVNEAVNVVFDFTKVEYYGADDFGIPFTTSVDCTLNYAVFKADYYSLDEEKMERMSIDERNRHYYDVDEEYLLSVQGVLRITLDSEALQDELDDSELDAVILQADTDVEIDEISVE